MTTQTTETECGSWGHQWHDTSTERVCAACLAEAPADPIQPEAPDDPKRQTTKTPDPRRSQNEGWREAGGHAAVNGLPFEHVDGPNVLVTPTDRWYWRAGWWEQKRKEMWLKTVR